MKIEGKIPEQDLEDPFHSMPAASFDDIVAATHYRSSVVFSAKRESQLSHVFSNITDIITSIWGKQARRPRRRHGLAVEAKATSDYWIIQKKKIPK